METPNTALIERIRSRCTEIRLTGCWEYRLSVNGSKYANTIRHALDLGGSSDMVQASRLSYIAMRGSIPDGYEVDHLCKNKTCVNPYHLEAVPASVNRRRNRIAPAHPLAAYLHGVVEMPPIPRVSDTGCVNWGIA